MSVTTMIRLSDGNKYKFSALPLNMRTVSHVEKLSRFKQEPQPTGFLGMLFRRKPKAPDDLQMIGAFFELAKISLQPNYEPDEVEGIIELVDLTNNDMLKAIATAFVPEVPA